MKAYIYKNKSDDKISAVIIIARTREEADEHLQETFRNHAEYGKPKEHELVIGLLAVI